MKKSAPKAKALAKTEKKQKQSMKKGLKTDTSKKNSKVNRGAMASGVLAVTRGSFVDDQDEFPEGDTILGDYMRNEDNE